MRAGLSLIGALAALTLVGVSASMNIAFLSALGRSDTECMILGAASGAADILKAVLPLFILWAWRAGRSRFVLPATAVWVVFAGFSLLSAFGFTAGNRIEAAAQQTALNDRLDRVQSEAAAARARIAALPASRPVAVIDAEIARLRQNVRWQSTRACTDATVPASRTYCAQYFARVGERASARAADELKAQLDQFARREEDLISQGAGRIADPQSSLLAGIFQVPENRVRLILITVLALVVELGSGLGLYLAAGHTPRRRGPARGDGVRDAADAPACPAKTLWPASRDLRSAGSVEDYCLGRLFPGTQSIGFQQVFADYRQWCDAKDYAHEARPGFEAALREIASTLNIAVSADALAGVRLGCASASSQRTG